jgi:SAM-dependent methyltransferase
MTLPIPPQQLRFMGESDEEFVRIGDEMVARIGSLVDLKTCRLVADIGCGYGRISSGFMRAQQFHGRYDGFDLLKPHIAWCQQCLANERFGFHHLPIYSERYNPKGTIKQADVRFDIADGGSDLVLLTSVFTHMYPDDVVHYLRECRRLVSDHGRIYATFFMMNDRQGQRFNVHPLPHALTEYCRYRDPEQPLHVIAYAEDWLRCRFADVGLRVDGPIRQGGWSGEPAAFDFQDTVLLAPVDS